MRYIMLLIVVAGFFSLQAYAQRGQISPEQRTQRLTDSLHLTAAESLKVVQIYMEMDQERKTLLGSDAGDRDSRMEAMRNLMAKTDAKIEDVLTPDQKIKYQELKKFRRQRRPGTDRRE
jgi:hypothetical protein